MGDLSDRTSGQDGNTSLGSQWADQPNTAPSGPVQTRVCPFCSLVLPYEDPCPVCNIQAEPARPNPTPPQPATDGSAWDWVQSRIYPDGCDPSRPIVGLLSEEHALALAQRCDRAEQECRDQWKVVELYLRELDSRKAKLADLRNKLADAERRVERLRGAIREIERLADTLSHATNSEWIIRRAEQIEDMARAALAETKEDASNE